MPYELLYQPKCANRVQTTLSAKSCPDYMSPPTKCHQCGSVTRTYLTTETKVVVFSPQELLEHLQDFQILYTAGGPFRLRDVLD